MAAPEPTGDERDVDDRIEKRMAISRALSRAGFRDVLTISREAGVELLSDPRIDLLDHLRENEPPSVRALADALGRDKAAVSRDLTRLAEFDVIEFEETGRSKAPRLKHETVVVEPIV